MKNLTILLITIAGIVIIFGSNIYSFNWGKRSVECPVVIKPDTIFYINQAEINRLQRWIKNQDTTINQLYNEKDSLKNLLSKKNETQIIVNDTFVPAILREWAEYQAHE